MAEYIEREALLSELQEEIDFETSMYTEEQNKYFNMGLKCAVRDVKSQPTADVVPKSEVERLEQENETLKDNNEHLAVILEEAKREVAREIFEEINEDCFDQFGYFEYEAYAELKKKYTEDKE